MPSLTMHPTDGCVVCGCRIGGILVGTYRINKRSLVSPNGGGGLTAFDPKCRECGEPVPWPLRWRLDAKSQTVVDEYRARKGWS